MSDSFSKLSLALINVFEQQEKELNDEKITVNDLVSKVAYFYEKFRTAMDYGSEETIPRRAIGRMLSRMLFLGRNSKSLANDLVRELIWAGYFPNATVPQSLIERVTHSIDLYLTLEQRIIKKKSLKGDDINEFILEILSCEIFYVLIPNKQKEAVSNFLFQIMKNSVEIEQDDQQTRDIQVFIAVRKSFARDDIAFLRYKLFTQIFGRLTEDNLEKVVTNFENGYKEIKKQLSYKGKEKILNHIKKKTPPFLILYDILSEDKGYIKTLALNDEALRQRVFDACDKRYRIIKRKVRTAIVRSVIFILFTKAIIGLSIEGTFESIVFKKVQWSSIFLNTVIPPLIMAGVGISIKTPNEENSKAIYEDIRIILFEENPMLLNVLVIKKSQEKSMSLRDYIFSILWLLSIMLTFGIIWFILGILHFNIISKFIFVFFIAIISFLSYRIYQTAHSYTVVRKKNILTPIFEFFFIPIIRVGQSLTEGFSQINFILLIIDFIIEAPFKGLIGFFEQWFLFVATKREELE